MPNKPEHDRIGAFRHPKNQSSWFDHDVALRALTFALGDDFRIVRQRDVDDASLFRCHRIERSGPPTRRRTGSALGNRVELLGSPEVITFDVDNNVRPLLQLAVHQHPDDELQIAQRFASPTDKQTCVISFDLEHDRTVAEFVKHISLDIHIHCSNQVTQHLARGGL